MTCYETLPAVPAFPPPPPSVSLPAGPSDIRAQNSGRDTGQKRDIGLSETRENTWQGGAWKFVQASWWAGWESGTSWAEGPAGTCGEGRSGWKAAVDSWGLHSEVWAADFL